jgi:anion-transporting  ArsA/GET3 family ATPase
VPGLLDRRLIFVTGKGGVGKSTVAMALGLQAARHGRRTIVAELARQDGVRRTFAQPGEIFQEVELADGLYTISVDPESAMEEYLRVKTGALGQALGASRLFQAFAMATPGMRELLSVGKVYELAQLTRHTGGADPYDLVIVDSPAAGHGIGILRTPRTFAEIARVGPIAGTAQRIAATVSDPGFTAIVAVCVAEEMPVNETLWLRDQLRADGLELGAVFVNALLPERFSAAEARRLQSAHERADGRARTGGRRGGRTGADGDGDADGDGALGAALSEHVRARAQREELARLRAGLGASVASVELPFLFAETLSEPELRALADALDGIAAG